jgi:hypothetical protein
MWRAAIAFPNLAVPLSHFASGRWRQHRSQRAWYARLHVISVTDAARFRERRPMLADTHIWHQ